MQVSNVSDDVESIQTYREKAIVSIKKLIQTEKNYIENLKAIQSFFTFFEENKEEKRSNEMEKPKSKLVPMESHDFEVVIPPMPEGLKEGRDRILFGNSKCILNFHEK